MGRSMAVLIVSFRDGGTVLSIGRRLICLEILAGSYCKFLEPLKS